MITVKFQKYKVNGVEYGKEKAKVVSVKITAVNGENPRTKNNILWG